MNEHTEPSVLDYVKSKVKFWQKNQVEIPAPVAEVEARERTGERIEEKVRLRATSPWRTLLALGVALFAQKTLEPVPGEDRTWILGLALYLAAFSLLLFAYRKGEWQILPLPQSESARDPLTVRWGAFIASLGLSAVTFYLMKGNRFTPVNFTLWVLAFVTHMWAFWLRDFQGESIWLRTRRFFTRPFWNIRITRWTLLIIAVAGLTLFFRFYHLSQVAPDMTSDHAEKLLDVYDILNGRFSIYFPRNTGREPLYVYLSALIAYLFTGVSFLTLKIAAVIGGVVMLPYLYLLGKEFGGKRIGLLAVLFAGIAYWPNVIERFGLRISFYPLFVAITYYYLIRGLRRQSRNDMILAGIALGLGLNGYTPFRIVPFVMIAAFIVYIIHARSGQERLQAILWFGLLALTAFIIFIPQARFALENPEIYGFRAFSRISSIEQPLPGPAWQIFLSNLWNALTMFNWNNGIIWVHSVTSRPALDVVSGALFLFGVLLGIIRYIRQRHWVDFFMLLSIPLLLMPSILSLAFPLENPSLNRTGGAIIPAFLFVGLALDVILNGLERRPARSTLSAELSDQRSITGWSEQVERSRISATGNGSGGIAHPFLMFFVIVGLLFVSSAQNYDLVFRQYYEQYRAAAWNTREMGTVLKQFMLAQGSAENAWIIPYPYWVDTRLPPIWAGIPQRGDMAIRPENLPDTLSITKTKLFMFKPDDIQTLATLRTLYPQGIINLYESDSGPGRDFYILFVPSAEPIPTLP